ncbi:tellurite resistance TerB family protein [uncultured Thiocystis sp.]|uniref:tellurite resistance TerB family protein n=1 Tax=uncultured Thiocystis sp. TaxID=1202134 RepID=UPI0025FE55BE|nr:tellurite resistance TerB family protein [uncultured Thiocystis sp.]
MNAFDILGAVMKAGMSPQVGNRMGSVLGQMMGGGAPGATPGNAPGGGVFDVLTKVAGSMMGGGQGGATGVGLPGSGGMGGFPGDLLKQVAGALLGGNAAQGNAGAGMGSLAIFGALAAQAIEVAKGMVGGASAQAGGLPSGQGMDDQTAVLAGLRAPANPLEQQQVMDVATLTLRAMISAAKADGHVDDNEKQRLLGKLGEGGITPEEQRFVEEEMNRSIDLGALARSVPNQQVAAQLYTASLMAITVDTDAERRYLAELANTLKLEPQVVAYLHQVMGLT